MQIFNLFVFMDRNRKKFQLVCFITFITQNNHTFFQKFFVAMTYFKSVIALVYDGCLIDMEDFKQRFQRLLSYITS